jgi:hypothetical protein
MSRTLNGKALVLQECIAFILIVSSARQILIMHRVDNIQSIYALPGEKKRQRITVESTLPNSSEIFEVALQVQRRNRVFSSNMKTIAR